MSFRFVPRRFDSLARENNLLWAAGFGCWVQIRQHSASLLFVNILTSAAVCWNWSLSLVDSHVARPVSYTHLDVYKRQHIHLCILCLHYLCTYKDGVTEFILKYSNWNFNILFLLLFFIPYKLMFASDVILWSFLFVARRLLW